jgi:S1-C subfamily serine protease
MKSSILQKTQPKKPSLLPNFSLLACSAIVATTAISLHHTPVNLFKRVSGSIVTVTSLGIKLDPFSPINTIENTQGTGTGFSFIGKDYIITNAHVVHDAFDIVIKSSDGKEYIANKVGEDNLRDIAVLKVTEGGSFKPLQKCTYKPEVGQSVFAIGTPFGFDHTLTSGILSGVQRSIDAEDKYPLTNLLQTDAAINPGSSGGVLLDSNSGCVIGMNTVIISPSGASSGVGFAIPISTVDQIARDIIHDRPSQKLQLGVTVLPDKYADMFEFKGVIIAQVIPESIADHLGLIGTYRDEYGRPMIGDIIVGVNDKFIRKRSDLYQILDTLNKNDKIEITVLRKDGIKVLKNN